MKLARKCFIVILAILILALIFLLIPFKERVSATEVDNSIDKSLIFLNKTYSKDYLFDDDYIKCIGQFSGCDAAYRKLDVAIVFMFFFPEMTKKNPLMAGVSRDSEMIISDQLDDWMDKPIKSLPIDLYAVFVYYYPKETKGMLKDLIDDLRPEGDWEDYTMYGPGFEWRKMADESWPIVALAKHNLSWDILKPTLEKKKYEAEMIMNGTWKWNKSGKYYGILSAYHVFLWVRDEGYDVRNYTKLIDGMADFLAGQPKDEDLSKWTVYTSDTLYWLCEGNYSNREFMNDIARVVLERQENDGGWRVNILKIGEKTPSEAITTKEMLDSGRTHATFMSILGLECYKSRYLMNS